jgi:isopropylmalate/homocitrate/citramalate synthase
MKEIIINEITIQDILNFWDDFTKNREENDTIVVIKKLLGVLTNLGFEEFLKTPPSKIVKIIEEVKEKNKNFFQIADCLGLGDLQNQILEQMKEQINQVKEQIKRDFTRAIVQVQTPKENS